MSRPESRRSYLMERAIEALDAYHDPLGSPFLVQHDVSLDEAADLCDQLSAGLQFLRIGMEDVDHSGETK
jgi:hypothetical protein